MKQKNRKLEQLKKSKVCDGKDNNKILTDIIQFPVEARELSLSHSSFLL